MGWQLRLPGVFRKMSRGVPRYADAVGAGADGPRADVFVLSGAENLVPVEGSHPGRVRYRPRTEGLFARIQHVRDVPGNYWEVRSRDGLLTRYGNLRPDDADTTWHDPALAADLGDPGRVFGWRITSTQDPLGNLIRYSYRPDQGQEQGDRWDHPLIARISHADYGDRVVPSFLVEMDFEYEPRPDPCSDCRPGSELRTSLRCRTIRVTADVSDGVVRAVREYRPTRTTDAAGLVTEADNDCRVLRPSVVTDVNSNIASVRFSPAGLVTAHFLRGKNGEGDKAAPSTQMTHDLLAFAARGQPTSVRRGMGI